MGRACHCEAWLKDDERSVPWSRTLGGEIVRRWSDPTWTERGAPVAVLPACGHGHLPRVKGDRALKRTDLMAGFPPSAEADQVTLANWRTAPFNKWSFTHLRELIPSAAIANDPDDVAELPASHRSISAGWRSSSMVREIRPRGLPRGDGYRRDDRPPRGQAWSSSTTEAGHGHAATPHFLRLRHQVGAGARRRCPRRKRGPRDGPAGNRLDPRGRRDRLGRRDPARPPRHAGRHPLRRGLSRHLGRHHRVPEGAGLGPARAGRGTLGPSDLVPEPHRDGRLARRRLPLRLPQHRPPRVGNRAGGRAALPRSRERASVAADGGNRRCLHHRRPPRCAPGGGRHVRDPPRPRARRAARREPGPAWTESRSSLPTGSTTS